MSGGRVAVQTCLSAPRAVRMSPQGTLSEGQDICQWARLKAREIGLQRARAIDEPRGRCSPVGRGVPSAGGTGPDAAGRSVTRPTAESLRVIIEEARSSKRVRPAPRVRAAARCGMRSAGPLTTPPRGARYPRNSEPETLDSRPHPWKMLAGDRVAPLGSSPVQTHARSRGKRTRPGASIATLVPRPAVSDERCPQRTT